MATLTITDTFSALCKKNPSVAALASDCASYYTKMVGDKFCGTENFQSINTLKVASKDHGGDGASAALLSAYEECSTGNEFAAYLTRCIP